MNEKDSVTQTPTALSVTEGRSLADVGRYADAVASASTFERYRERKAYDTIRRHKADIALFASYLMQIPDMQVLGNLYLDPFAWRDMSRGLVEGFVLWQLQRGYAIGSVNMRLSTIKLYCKLAQGQVHLTKNMQP
ncbi:MAG: hypothetical protein NVSMB38_34960 [Ktedonobacteraceae bacterium]